MYVVRTTGYSKRDQVRRWALTDRVFFACGACHILAHAFLERYGEPGDTVLWIKPKPGWTGNHIVVARQGWIFDFHGVSRREAFFRHVAKRCDRLWPGWSADLVELPRAVLIDECGSRQFDGLHLRAPAQFLHDPLPRAARFLERGSNLWRLDACGRG